MLTIFVNIRITHILYSFWVIGMIFSRIRDLREDSDKKQIELAKYLNVDQSTYSDYERGKINIPIEQLIRIADFYNVSLDYLVGRDDVPNRKQRKFST